MTVATTQTGLLRAILDDPAADDLRLFYADVLEEEGKTECAEFVRVQVELAQKQNVHSEQCPCLTCKALRRRERELLDATAHWSGWTHAAFDHLAYEVGVSTDGHRQIVRLYNDRKDQLGEFACLFRRGFVSEASCRLVDWCGEECPLCHATYDELRGTFGCKVYDGTGRANVHGPALVQTAPIETVVLTDRKPWCSLLAVVDILAGDETLEKLTSFWWFSFDVPPSDESGAAAQLPACIMAHLPIAGFMGQGRRAWRCYNHDEANAAASLACVNWARSIAGLPLLP